MEYRQDINGLRAIAVLAVVLYHLGIWPLGGGFVGVDVFFVISGYLIAGTVQREIEQQRFSFAGFYERRVRRLAPALLTVLLVTLIVGYWLLLPTDLVLLGKSTLATLFFSSNIFFWRLKGYFDGASEINLLLHMWSLAVEEQFYIFFPILLLLVHRYARLHLRRILAGCALLSFAACVLVQHGEPTAAFYLAPFRAWELLAGALLAVRAVPQIAQRGLREAIAAIALLTLLASLVLIHADVGFPGWEAAIPVLATAILLQTGEGNGSLVHRLLRTRVLVSIGLMSYSLYLWYWPLLVYTRYANGLVPLNIGERVLVLLAALALSKISYLWIERPFRRSTAGSPHSHARVLGVAALVACAPLALALTTWTDQGLRFRVSRTVAEVDATRTSSIPYAECDRREPDSGLCRIGDATKSPKILVWGDSHALAWAPAFDAVLRSREQAAYIAIQSSCPPLIGVDNPIALGCANHNIRVLNWIRANRPSAVFMLAFWSSYSSPDGKYVLRDEHGNVGNGGLFPLAFAQTVNAIRPVTGNLVVVGPTPGAPDDVLVRLALALRKGSSLPPPKAVADMIQEDAYFWKTVGPFRSSQKIAIIDPAPWFCDKSGCRYRDADGVPLYRDDGHLDAAGAGFLVPNLAFAMQHYLFR